MSKRTTLVAVYPVFFSTYRHCRSLYNMPTLHIPNKYFCRRSLVENTPVGVLASPQGPRSQSEFRAPGSTSRSLFPQALDTTLSRSERAVYLPRAPENKGIDIKLICRKCWFCLYSNVNLMLIFCKLHIN